MNLFLTRMFVLVKYFSFMEKENLSFVKRNVHNYLHLEEVSLPAEMASHRLHSI